MVQILRDMRAVFALSAIIVVSWIVFTGQHMSYVISYTVIALFLYSAFIDLATGHQTTEELPD